ncbi:MAG: hypothetical protein IT338_14465 [Thermomicrobiales bacterium]|nr:hypothetical protein [Thermomicrobiales bacterium]
MRAASVAPPGQGRQAVSLEPASAYEAVTRQMVLDLGEELREIKGRLNGLLFLVAGSVLLDVVLRVLGRG